MKILHTLQNALNKMPSTNVRIAATILVILATAARYLMSHCLVIGNYCVGWVPDGNWLMFLAALSGVDTLHFLAKRSTQFKDDNETTSIPPATDSDSK